MRSRHGQLPAVEMIRGPSSLDVDAPAEVTSPHLCDPPDASDWTTHCFALIEEPHGPLTLSTPFIKKHRAVFAPGEFVIDQFEPDGVFRADADLPVGTDPPPSPVTSIEASAGLGRVAPAVGQPISRVSLCQLQALLGSSGELAGVEEIMLAERLLKE